MTRRFMPPSAEGLARIREMAERPLSAEEFRRRVEAPLDDAEREEMRELIRWFVRRYPTPYERLRSARRLYRDWSRNIPR